MLRAYVKFINLTDILHSEKDQSLINVRDVPNVQGLTSVAVASGYI